MKTNIIFGGVVIGLLALLIGANRSNESIIYEAQNEPTVIETEVEVDIIADRVKTAQEAAQAEITAKAQAEYDAVYTMEMAKIEARVLQDIEAEIAATRLEVEKNIQSY